MINFILWFFAVFVIIRNVVGLVMYSNHPLFTHPASYYKWDAGDLLGLLAIIGLFIRYW